LSRNGGSYPTVKSSSLCETSRLRIEHAAGFQNLLRRTPLPVSLACSVLDLISQRVKSKGYFAVEWVGSQAAQFNNLVLNQGQPLDVANHEGRL
jgi:hypothetical protein